MATKNPTTTENTTTEKTADPRDSITVTTMIAGAGLPGVGVATVAKALDDSGIDRHAKPTEDQALRTASAQAGDKAGLRGRALALWVITGESNGNGATKAADKVAAAVEAPKTAPKAVKSVSKKAAKYPVEITEAVRLAKEARGTTNGAPGAKQHVMVRKAVGNATVPEILKAAGVKSEKQLRAIADGSSSKEDVALLRPLGQTIPDPFCKGRNLASMLVALIVQVKAKKS